MCLCNKCDNRIRCLTDNKKKQDLTLAVQEREDWANMYCNLIKIALIGGEITLVIWIILRILKKGV